MLKTTITEHYTEHGLKYSGERRNTEEKEEIRRRKKKYWGERRNTEEKEEIRRRKKKYWGERRNTEEKEEIRRRKKKYWGERRNTEEKEEIRRRKKKYGGERTIVLITFSESWIDWRMSTTFPCLITDCGTLWRNCSIVSLRPERWSLHCYGYAIIVWQRNTENFYIAKIVEKPELNDAKTFGNICQNGFGIHITVSTSAN